MGNDDNENPRPPGDDKATEPPDPADGKKIGYKRPPAKHQFKKGQSGNPKGRPKRARGLKTEAAEVLDEKFPLASSGKTVSAIKAMLLKQREKAIKHGDARATAMLLDFARDRDDEEAARVSQAEREARDEHDRALIDAALLRLAKPGSGDAQ